MSKSLNSWMFSKACSYASFSPTTPFSHMCWFAIFAVYWPNKSLTIYSISLSLVSTPEDDLGTIASNGFSPYTSSPHHDLGTRGMHASEVCEAFAPPTLDDGGEL